MRSEALRCELLMARGDAAFPLAFAPLKEAAGCAHAEHSGPLLAKAPSLQRELAAASLQRERDACDNFRSCPCFRVQAGCAGPRAFVVARERLCMGVAHAGRCGRCRVGTFACGARTSTQGRSISGERHVLKCGAATRDVERPLPPRAPFLPANALRRRPNYGGRKQPAFSLRHRAWAQAGAS